MIIFATHNVLKDPPFTHIDLISCRNLLIYLGPEAQNVLLPLLHFSLKPEGILFLGNSETVGQHNTLFSPIEKKWKIYSKLNIQSPDRPKYEFPSGRQNIQVEAKTIRRDTTSDIERGVEKLLLRYFQPDCVIVNSKGDIVYIYGHT
jgi:two-component system CheB/CheR fusion protein